jgi:biotin carboxyl carrier protein
MKHFKFSIKGQNYDVEVKEFEGNQAVIEVNGTTYEVELHRELRSSKTPVLVRQSVKTSEDEHRIRKEDTGTHKVRAPLPGIIMNILVREGDMVKKGQKLLVYEAMKMENNILSEKEGMIKSIKVVPGDNVLQDDVLLEIQ